MATENTTAPAPTPSLAKIVANAADEIEATPTPNPTETGEVEVEDGETETAEESGETETAEDEMSEAEREEARNLYKALKDPKTSAAIIAALAQQAGLSLSPNATKSEVKEAKSNVKDIVKEALGPQYEFLADKLGTAIDKAIQIESEKQNVRFAEIQQQQVEREVTTAYEKLARETKGESKKLETRMATLAEEIPIGKMNVETYIRRLYTIASTDAQKTSAKAVADRIRKNSTDAPARLRATSATMSDHGLDLNVKRNLKDSVQAALDSLQSQRR